MRNSTPPMGWPIVLHLCSRSSPGSQAAAMPWLRESGDAETIAQLRAYLAGQPRKGIEPEDLWALEELGYHVELSWLNTDANGAFDAVLQRRDVPVSFATSWRAPDGRRRSWQDFANHPHRAKLNRQLIPQIRKFLEDKLPHYMMPSVFTVLEELPLSPTGKIDRRALAQLPATVESEDEKRFEIHSPVERMLVQVWADVLNMNHVGVDDNFFSLGGNSLNAMELTHRLQKQLNRPLRPVTLLKAPTVSQFAAYLQKTYPELTIEQAGSGVSAVTELHEGDI